MDIDEALKLLRGGPAGLREWARRRRAGEQVPLLLLGAAQLADAELRGAYLSLARLVDSDLSGANLYGADFFSADLSGANLSQADLRRTNLHSANLSGANLSGTVFDEAHFAYTTIDDVDLSESRGLETVRFTAPCSIGVDTLVRSKGRIPKSFLEGCGVPDLWIEYLPSLIASQEPIQYSSCFISHSHEDRAFCERLHSRMRKAKLRVWYAPEDMKGGRKLHGEIVRQIRLHDKLLLVLSEQSMRSEWVATEIHAARKREIEEKRQILFPIRLVDMAAIKQWECFDADSGKDMAREVREYFIPDFSEWRDEARLEGAFARLLADLKASAK